MDLKTWEDLRPEVQEFALLMELKLREKDGWQEVSNGGLFARLNEETYELWHKVTYGANSLGVGEEAADVANFAMMLYDNAKRRAGM